PHAAHSSDSCNLSPLLPACVLLFFFLLIRQPPRPSLFPYTTLFRSCSPTRSTGTSGRSATSSSGTTAAPRIRPPATRRRPNARRSEEHTSELQSLTNLVCRLLLEKKKTKRSPYHSKVQHSRKQSHVL